MKRILSIEECRPFLLGILKHFDSFCMENDIQYSLAYGTLIGAIRHNGFIPWDDDIDIVMTRANYDRFISLYKSDGRYDLKIGNEIANHLHSVLCDNHTCVEFKDGTTDNFFYHGGLWVDLFPLDNVPSAPQEYERLWKRIKLLRQFQMISEVGGMEKKSSLKRTVCSVLCSLMRPFHLSCLFENCLNKVMQKYNSQDTDYVASLSVWYWKQPSFPKSFFNRYSLVPFEGCRFMAIQSYDEYLRLLYGDYMVYPPEDKRVPKHGYTPFLIKNEE